MERDRLSPQDVHAILSQAGDPLTYTLMAEGSVHPVKPVDVKVSAAIYYHTDELNSSSMTYRLTEIEK